MSKVVYKYELTAKLPVRHKFIHFGPQSGTLYLWLEVDPDSPVTESPYLVYGTGMTLPDHAIHMASAIEDGFVWHLYLLGGSQ